MKPLFLCAILLVSFLPLANVSATSEEVCCDSTTVELYLLGPASSGELSPFEAELSEESEEKKISDAIAQQEEIGSWEINPSWPGSYPSSTWEFSIDYEVANAGGAQINASVEVEIGGDTYTGTTDQSNSFLPAGSGQLTISVNVDAGSIPSSTAVTVTLSAQTVVFSVPGTDAGLTFSWGGTGDESSVTADLPIVSLRLDEPITDGMEVYLSMIVASPFGQMTAAHANTLELRVNGGMVSGDPIVTSSGDFVRLTWTWIATTSGEQQISVEASIQIQSGTPIQSGTTTFTIEPFDDGNDGGGGVQGFAFIGPTGDVRDGITVLYNAFGTVGTLKPGREKNRTLTHEMGHYLTLLHPFWNTSSCSAEGDCAVIGDEICDTPTTLENGSCTEAACPGALLENYMDYAPTSCRNMFTAGQRDRMRTCLSTVRSGLLESDGGIPVVASDLQLQPLGEYEVCSTFWEPQLRILNQGTSTMQGGEIAWSINGVAMPNVAFDDVLLPDETAIVFMPPTPLPVDTSEWIFAVRLAEGSLDEYNLNDSLVETVFRSPGEAWTLTFTTDFFGVDLGWSVTDTAGLVVWERSDYPIGSNTYIEQGCLQTGCYTLELTDADGDGYGDTDSEVTACSQPTGYASADGDCDDTDPSIHPGAPDPCYDGIDSNCNEDDNT